MATKKKHIRFSTVLVLVLLLTAALTVPAFAVTEAEVEAQVSAVGKETVTGNVLIWFLCAVAFLKVSQKIDSFMASLGVNVGHTGGSMLAEAMIATRGIASVAGAFGGGGGRRAGGSASGGGGSSGSSGAFGFLKGGLAGVVSRKVTSDAVKTATTATSAVNTVKSKASTSAAHTATASNQQSSQQVSRSTQTATQTAVQTAQHTAASSSHVNTQTVSAQMTSREAQSVSSQSASHETQAVSAQTVTQNAETLSAQTISHNGQEIVSQTAAHTEQSAQIVTQSAQTIPAQAVPQEQQPASMQTASNEQASIVQGSVQPPQTAVQPPQAASVQGHSQAVHTSAVQTQTAAHTQQSSVSAAHTEKRTSIFKGVGLGGAIFARSLMSGGSFANDVIGTVAKGDIRSTGSITGELAAQSLQSYMGNTALGEGAKDVPMFSNVEIGGGRITGVETAPGSTEGLAFSMYHAEQYTAPQGDYTKVHSADGALWYKQYAQDAVERKPYMAPDDTVAYHERIVKKLPDPPKRKDRI